MVRIDSMMSLLYSLINRSNVCFPMWCFEAQTLCLLSTSTSTQCRFWLRVSRVFCWHVVIFSNSVATLVWFKVFVVLILHCVYQIPNINGGKVILMKKCSSWTSQFGSSFTLMLFIYLLLGKRRISLTLSKNLFWCFFSQGNEASLPSDMVTHCKSTIWTICTC